MKTIHVLLSMLAAALAVLGSSAPAWGDEKTERRRTQLLAEMRALAEQSTVTYESGAAQPKLVEKPVFRYDDQPRRFIDATMWVWTDEGRPVAFQKIEAEYHVTTDQPQWGYCFTSVSENLIAAGWKGEAGSSEKSFRSKEPGIEFREVAGAPALGATTNQRRRQAREISRQFQGTMLMDPINNITQEMRLLPTPIFEYSDETTKLLRGAVFGYAINGTNPDMLILIEARGDGDRATWHFAPARMTNGGITLRHNDKQVWEIPWLHPSQAPFSTWTFFKAQRKPVADE